MPDAEIALQAHACRLALATRIAAEGLIPPRGFTISPMASGNIHVHLGGGADAPGDPIVQIEHAWSVDRAGHVSKETLQALDASVRLAIRRRAQTHEIRSVPSWAVLVHPVLLATLLAHEPDRRRMPVRGRTCEDVPSGRWDLDDEGNVNHPGTIGNAHADAWLAHGVMQTAGAGVLMQMGDSIASVTAVSVASATNPDMGRTTLAAPLRLPDTVLAVMDGRRFGEIVAMPATGHHEVDRACAACIIQSHREMANGIEFTFGPSELLPYGVAPDAERMRAMRMSPILS